MKKIFIPMFILALITFGVGYAMITQRMPQSNTDNNLPQNTQNTTIPQSSSNVTNSSQPNMIESHASSTVSTQPEKFPLGDQNMLNAQGMQQTSTTNQPLQMQQQVNQTIPTQRAQQTNQSQLTQNNPVYTLQLKSNRTTGYSWFIMNYDHHLLTLKRHRYVTDNTTKGLMGAGGYEIFEFQATPQALTAPHKTTIKMIYARPWELKAGQIPADAKVRTFTVNIE